jgi:hypothetical protein
MGDGQFLFIYFLLRRRKRMDGGVWGQLKIQIRRRA